MNIFRLFQSKKNMKVCSKTHQIAPFKKIFLVEACPRTPRANACVRRCALRIHSGRQLIVCSTLYVYALQNLSRGQKMTKIVAQHILKCITWALFSNTMCP